MDGIAFGAKGPVLVHGYDPPAGGKWIEDFIPGKLAALERQTGERLWVSPCEVGYGRGFGAGFGEEDDVVVLGPSAQGHGIARMSLETGELIGAREIKAFDEAVVGRDVCVCVTPRRVCGILTTDMVESWVYSREGERYHMVGRAGEEVFVVYGAEQTQRQGVLRLHAETGEFLGTLVEPTLSPIHCMSVDGGALVLVLDDIESALPPDSLRDWLSELSLREEEDDLEPAEQGSLWLLALSPEGEPGQAPLWFEPLPGDHSPELPDVSLGIDAGRLYVARGALMAVRDSLTGRVLGDLTVPGLDEYVAWKMSEGAGLLAEETRLSVFEIPD